MTLKYLTPPPEGVIKGESIPRENEKEDYEKMYERMKKTRRGLLDREIENEKRRC